MAVELPKLPIDVSPDGREIWDWAASLSRHRQHIAKLRELNAIANAPRRCGDCHSWMKSSECPYERNVNGRNKGPSCNGSPCSKFQETGHATKRRETARIEYARLSTPEGEG